MAPAGRRGGPGRRRRPRSRSAPAASCALRSLSRSPSATGAGLTLLLIPLVNVVLAAVPVEVAGGASGLFSTAQQLGGAIGVAIGETVFFGQLSGHSFEAAVTHTMPYVTGAFILCGELSLMLPRTAVADEFSAPARPAASGAGYRFQARGSSSCGSCPGPRRQCWRTDLKSLRGQPGSAGPPGKPRTRWRPDGSKLKPAARWRSSPLHRYALGPQTPTARSRASCLLAMAASW